MKLSVAFIFWVGFSFPLISATNRLVIFEDYLVFRHVKSGLYLGWWRQATKRIIPNENYFQIYDMDNGNKIIYAAPFLTPMENKPVYTLGSDYKDCVGLDGVPIKRDQFGNRTDQYWRINTDDTITSACDFNYALTLSDTDRVVFQKKNNKKYSFEWEAIQMGHPKSWM